MTSARRQREHLPSLIGRGKSPIRMRSYNWDLLIDKIRVTSSTRNKGSIRIAVATDIFHSLRVLCQIKEWRHKKFAEWWCWSPCPYYHQKFPQRSKTRIKCRQNNHETLKSTSRRLQSNACSPHSSSISPKKQQKTYLLLFVLKFLADWRVQSI